MRYQTDAEAGWENPAQSAAPLPRPDSETLSLLRSFLRPILETGQSWSEIATALTAKDYRLSFRSGHLVILNAAGEALCTGADLGVPLRSISARIGRPAIRAGQDGKHGELQSR